MSEIKNCPQCGWPRYQQGRGSHVGTGSIDCPDDGGTPRARRQRQKLTRRWR